jgi:hypothetical protein
MVTYENRNIGMFIYMKIIYYLLYLFVYFVILNMFGKIFSVTGQLKPATRGQVKSGQ